MEHCNVSDGFPIPYHFETIIGTDLIRKFLRSYWHFSIYASIIYLAVIYFLQRYMKTRPPFDLKRTTITWNGFLAFYSICSTIRGIPVFYFGFSYFTFYCMVCDKAFVEKQPQLVFWLTIFLFSKMWELGDTMLIILRKRNLMFMHWYHHITTLLMMWYAMFREASIGVFYFYLNVIVHSFMYTYFVAKLMDIKIPKTIAMFITTIQTLQMMVGMILCVWVFWLFSNNYECDTPVDASIYFTLMYISYLYMFSHLFYVHYIKPVRSHEKKN